MEVADIGRPIAHFALSLQGINLTVVSSQVLKTLDKHESELYDDKGRCFFTRILPYRTTNNVIDGVIISFEDITHRKKAEQALINSERRYKSLFDFSPVPMWETDLSGIELALHELRHQGVTDLNEHLTQHPQEAERLLKVMRVLHINNAAMTLFKADNKEKLASSIPELLIRSSLQPFITQLQAIWDQKDKLSYECHCDDLQGNSLALNVEWVVPCEVSQLNYSNVIVLARLI